MYCKIAGQATGQCPWGRHGRCRHNLLADALAFITEEEERLVPDHGTTDSTAERVLLECRRQGLRRGAPGLGFDCAVADELVERSVEFVRALLGNHDDLAAREAPVIRRVDAGKELELADGFDRRPERGLVGSHVVVEGAVYQKLVVGLGRAVDVEPTAETEG